MVLVGQGLSPYPQPPGGGVPDGERDTGPLLRAPLRGRPGCEEPLATSVAPPLLWELPAEMPELGLLEGLVLYFHYPAHPVEALSRLPGLCRIYLFASSEHKAEGIGSLGSSPRILSGMPSHSSLEGAKTSKKVGWGKKKTRDQPCLVWKPALEFWLVPENGLPPNASWGSRAADHLATGLWVQPSLQDALGRY